MSSSRHVQAPPGMGTVYRATLDAMAVRGPRRVGVTHIARLADSNRQYFYRNWASPQVLLREAALQELKRVLHVALEVHGPLPPPECLAVRFVVRAARLLREHPVVAAMARTEPAMTYAAVLRTDTEWHGIARQWLAKHVTPQLRGSAERDTVTLAVLTTALPYALIPPEEPPSETERAAVDTRLSQALHACLGLPPTCPD
ncbi:TetR/AcrR family transcriptional regulator [Streptomyces hokutonensis]|uniref:TetR/AcrR family transcriptional regulator n=1 Tax=Streptomyces hokutonensis TaxID=1306990 RepID=UPI0036C46339